MNSDGGNFFSRTIDDAYYLLEDMAEYNYWCLTCSMNNQSWENNLNNRESWCPTQTQETGLTPMELIAQTLVRMDKTLEEFKEFGASIRMDVNLLECHLGEPTSREKLLLQECRFEKLHQEKS